MFEDNAKSKTVRCVTQQICSAEFSSLSLSLDSYLTQFRIESPSINQITFIFFSLKIVRSSFFHLPLSFLHFLFFFQISSHLSADDSLVLQLERSPARTLVFHTLRDVDRDFPSPHFVNNCCIRYTRTRSSIIGTWPTILRTILLAR